MMPLGVSALADAIAARTTSRLMPYLNNGWGFSSTRTAGSALPPISAKPTPLTCDSRWLITFCAES